MAKHVIIKIYDNDKVEIFNDKDEKLDPTAQDVIIKPGKIVGQAFWWNTNPTCVSYGGQQY